MLPVHPAAELFPLLGDVELRDLAEHIREHGLMHSVVMLDGAVLDGRNRLAACEIAGVAPTFVEWRGDDPIAWVIGTNLKRRHLDTTQRAMIALAVLPMYEAAARERQGRRTDISPISGGGDDGKASVHAAAAAGVGKSAVERAKRIVTDAPDLGPAMHRGVLSLEQAATVATLPEAERPAAVEHLEHTPKGERTAEAKKLAHVGNNSGNNEWYTPPDYIAAARACMGGIDVDPASNEVANRTVDAARYFTAADNGLEQEWRGRVWLNPPYAQPLIAEFAQAIAAKREAGEVAAACVLVNNATDTAWFHRLLDVAAAVCLIRGRVRFLGPDGAKGAPLQGQAVVYVGEDVQAFREHFGAFGRVLVVG